MSISNPNNETVNVITKSGKITAKLTWNNVGSRFTKSFSKAQTFLDSEILRTTTPFVPIKTGTLRKSGQLGTVIGSGEIVWNTPYAKRQYYSTSTSRSYDAQCGAKWFERSKTQNLDSWITGTKKIAGG